MSKKKKVMKEASVGTLTLFPIENSGAHSISGLLYTPPHIREELKNTIISQVSNEWRDAESKKSEYFQSWLVNGFTTLLDVEGSKVVIGITKDVVSALKQIKQMMPKNIESRTVYNSGKEADA